jgi:hypothetical protein
MSCEHRRITSAQQLLESPHLSVFQSPVVRPVPPLMRILKSEVSAPTLLSLWSLPTYFPTQMALICANSPSTLDSRGRGEGEGAAVVVLR